MHPSNGIPGRLMILCLALSLQGPPGCSSSDDGRPSAQPPPPTEMPDGKRVEVTIDPGEAAGELEDRYLGFALDTAQITGGYWWSSSELAPPEPEVTPDLESPKLRRLAAYLAPSRMRIGGTDCDGYYFCPEEGECELPPAYQDPFRDRESHIPTTMTHEDVRRVANFAEAAGARIMFCINVGPGPRDPVSGAWTPDNGRQLIRFAKSLPNGSRFDLWEPGNEVNLLTFHFNTPTLVTPDVFAADVEAFADLLDAEAPGDGVAAPGSYFLPFHPLGDLMFTSRLLGRVRGRIDWLTWHLYATQSERCDAALAPDPASRENLFREDLEAGHRGYARYAYEAAAGLPVMNGESASAQCGGQEGVSDTLLDALWFADWIGILAEEGSRAVVRQTLVGSDYGMLDPDTYDPRPAFLAYVMYRRTVEGLRLRTDVDRSEVKAHGFCAAGLDGGVAAVLVNPTEEALAVGLELEGTGVVAARQWTVGANGDLTATRATINGLAAADDGTIPEPPGARVYLEDGKAYARLDPNALVFVVMEPEAAGALCGTGP